MKSPKAKAVGGGGSKRSTVLLGVPFAAIVALPLWLAPEHSVVKNFGAADVVQLLTILFVVALLAERAIEIYVGAWRGPTATHLEAVVKTREGAVAEHLAASSDGAALSEARKALEDAKAEERRYTCATRQHALWLGLVLGLLVSGVGLRALETLIDSRGWAPSQLAAFRVIDMVLTGGVIAGGSEGIHRVATVFENFMNFMSTTAKRAATATPAAAATL